MIRNQTLAEIKYVVNSHIKDADVMLFGSRAKGSNADDSDYDILIVTKSDYEIAQKIPLRTLIRKDLLKLGIRSDVILQSKSEIEKKKKLPGHFIRSIIKETILL